VAAGKSFSLAVAAFCKKANLAPSLVARKVCLDLLVSIVMGTPVDTGRARGSWTAGIYTMPEGAGYDLDKQGTATIARNQGILAGFELSRGSAFVLSNLVYMPPLEYGHSQQAPNGMVRVSISRYQEFVRRAVLEVNPA